MKKKYYAFTFLFFMYGLMEAKAQIVIRASVATDSTFTDSILSGGVYRKYVLYVPAIYYNSADTVPLVFNIHGYTGSGDQQMEYGNFRPIADTANFIVVHPTGLKIAPLNAPGWNVLGTVSQGQADRAFIIDLMDTLNRRYNIDSNRVYSAGFSQGGFMSYIMAGFNNTRFAAIASVSGSLVDDYFQPYAPSRPTPVMAIHGTSDGVIGYNGNAGFVATVPVDSLLKCWRSYNNCSATPIVTNLPDNNTGDGSTVEHYIWNNGTQGVSVELYKIISGEHAWPSDVGTGGVLGVASRNMDFNASKEIWRFFSQYKLATPVASSGPFVITLTPGGNTAVDALPSSNTMVSFYPNPSNGDVYISLLGVEQAQVEIFSVTGELVYHEIIQGGITELALYGLNDGMYFCQLRVGDTLIHNDKLIVHK
jgi:polyhydroxybutyrate depolymerase